MSSIQVYERMWQFMTQAETGVFVSSNEEGVRRVRESKGKYAFLTGSHFVFASLPFCDHCTVFMTWLVILLCVSDINNPSL